jgi:hypothetical protein
LGSCTSTISSGIGGYSSSSTRPSQRPDQVSPTT